MRKEDTSSTVCCGRATFSTYSLRLVITDKNVIAITFERPEEIKNILKLLENKNSQIKMGYSDELAEFYGIKN